MSIRQLGSKMGWEIGEGEWPDFKGRIFEKRPKHLVELLENTVSNYPDRVGFISHGQKLTFKEFDQVSDKIAGELKRYHVKKGDRVSLLLGNSLDFPLCFFALMKLGAI